MRDALSRLPSPALSSIAAVAICVASVVAYYASAWWLAALLAFAIAAAALAVAADRQIMELPAREPSPRATLADTLAALRGFSVAVALLAAVSFVLIGIALVMRSPGAGG